MERRASSRECVTVAPQSKALDVAVSVVGLALSYGLMYVAWRMSRMWGLEDENYGSVPRACALWLARRKRRTRLTEHEVALAASVVAPEALTSTLDDVGGLEDVIDEIRDLVVLPLKRPDIFASASKLIRAPRGVLLYGEPGTGKSLLARAVARDSGAALLNVRGSTLCDKYFGESNKLVAAMFSLASKLAPAIIFLDEVDGFLSARSSRDADVTLALKAEFMCGLDGFLTESAHPGVVVLAATNRPYDLDPAVLRRFSRQFQIRLPDKRARLAILALLLRNERCAADLDAVADATLGYSGSDLEELCRAAATAPIRELCRQTSSVVMHTRRDDAPAAAALATTAQPRPIDDADFGAALNRVRPTGAEAYAYRAQQSSPSRRVPLQEID